jgi:hypothetical protein
VCRRIAVTLSQKNACPVPSRDSTMQRMQCMQAGRDSEGAEAALHGESSGTRGSDRAAGPAAILRIVRTTGGPSLYFWVMPLDIPAIQKSLAIDQVDGWLLYDFHGSNPIAVALAGLTGRHTTRRWFYFIPASGRPQKLVHAIEPGMLDALPGDKTTYAGRRELEQGVTEMVKGCKIVAMEYSAECAIPYLSRVDAGTVDFLRRIGLRIVSSGDLVGRFEVDRRAGRDAPGRLREAAPHQGQDVRTGRREAHRR